MSILSEFSARPSTPWLTSDFAGGDFLDEQLRSQTHVAHLLAPLLHVEVFIPIVLMGSGGDGERDRGED